MVVELKLQLEVQNITINAFNVKRYSLYIVCQPADRLLFICTRLTYIGCLNIALVIVLIRNASK